MSTARAAMLVGIGVIGCFLVIGGGLYWLFALAGPARKQPPALEVWVARHVLHSAIPGDAAERKNPLPPTAQNASVGQQYFFQKCAICHGLEGTSKTEIGDGQYPHPPDLRGSFVQGIPDGGLFHIIRNGVRYTGMPGWQIPDEGVWQLVIFIRTLPQGSSPQKSSR
jgi:mono/diheme cytochrome c family protein